MLAKCGKRLRERHLRAGAGQRVVIPVCLIAPVCKWREEDEEEEEEEEAKMELTSRCCAPIRRCAACEQPLATARR